MRALLALVGATVVACAAAPPPRTIGNRAPIPTIDVAWRQLRVRPPHPPASEPSATALVERASSARLGTCERTLYDTWMKGPDRLVAYLATLATRPGRCRAVAARFAASLAPAQEREELAGCTAFQVPRARALWELVAQLTANPAHHRAALRNAAEVAWRAAARRPDPSRWRDAAAAFAEAATAGDRQAGVIEVAAWHNLLVGDRQAARHRRGGFDDALAALRRRQRALAHTAAGAALARELAAWRADGIAGPPPPR
ncbi:MAG: hypothetical protein R3B06_01560 [Kofleriaceae bacterium]